MARPKGSFKSTPKYRMHKATGQAVVTIAGKDHYLGTHDSRESWERYYRLLAEWSSTDKQIMPGTSPAQITVSEIIAAYWASSVKTITEISSLDRRRLALRPLRELYGSTKAAEFGSRAYKAVRENVIARKTKRTEEPLARRTINGYMWVVMDCFRWAVTEELIPSSVYHSLQAVKFLKKGEAGRETDRVRPVDQADLDATLPLLPTVMRDICNVMLLTGGRSGEITRLRVCDLDMSKPVWVYKPSKHKTDYLGYTREIYIGPAAQEIIRPYLTHVLSDFLFKAFRPGRPLNQNQAPLRKHRGRNRSTKPVAIRTKKRASHIDGETLRRWVQLAAQRADVLAHADRPEVAADVRIVAHWHPHQLRHNAATLLTNKYGIDVARACLGHRETETTEGYAERDGKIAARVMAEVG